MVKRYCDIGGVPHTSIVVNLRAEDLPQKIGHIPQAGTATYLRPMTENEIEIEKRFYANLDKEELALTESRLVETRESIRVQRAAVIKMEALLEARGKNP